MTCKVSRPNFNFAVIINILSTRKSLCYGGNSIGDLIIVMSQGLLILYPKAAVQPSCCFVAELVW